MTRARADHEARHTESDHGDALADVVRQLPRVQRAEHPEPDTQQHAEHERDEADLERDRQRLADQARDRGARRQRDAEVAAQHRAQPGEELLRRRLTDAVVAIELGMLGGAEQSLAHPERRRDRIAGQESQDHEDHDRDAEQRHEHADQSPGDRDQHALIPRARCMEVCRGYLRTRQTPTRARRA